MDQQPFEEFQGRDGKRRLKDSGSPGFREFPGRRGKNGNPRCEKRKRNMPFHRVSSFPRLRIPPVLKKGQRLPACPGKGVSRPHFPLDGCPKDGFASPAHGRVLLHTHHGGPLLRLRFVPQTARFQRVLRPGKD